MAKELPGLVGRHIDVLLKSRDNIPTVAKAFDLTEYCPLRDQSHRVILLFHLVTPRFPELSIELVDCHLDSMRGESYTLSVPALGRKESDDSKIFSFLTKRFGIEEETLLQLIDRLK